MCLEEVFQVREDSTKNQNIFLVDVSEGGGGVKPPGPPRKHTLCFHQGKKWTQKKAQNMYHSGQGGGETLVVRPLNLFYVCVFPNLHTILYTFPRNILKLYHQIFNNGTHDNFIHGFNYPQSYLIFPYR